MATFLGEDIETTARGLALTIRCASPDCNEPLFQFNGFGLVRMVAPCCKCGRLTQVRSTLGEGISIDLLPKRARARGQREGA